MIGDFHLLRPYWLLALIPLALLLWLYWHRTVNNRNWQTVCDEGLLPYILIGADHRQKKWPLVMFALTAIVAITALAGPVWKQLQQPVFRDQSALVIVLDLSRSMDAGDIKPSRLARARHKVNDILNRRREGQTALVVYAGDAHVVSPLTQDADTIINLAKTLDTALMPVQGSRVNKALEMSIKLLQQSGIAAGRILLITDGIAPDMVDKMSGLINDSGHQLSVLGVGTKQGAPISLADGGYLKDGSGAIVLPKLESRLLRQLAQKTGGRYRTLGVDDRDLDALLDGHKLDYEDNAEDSSLNTDRWREEGPWLLLVILPFAALAFRRGYLVMIVAIMLPITPNSAQAFEWGNLWSRPDQQAAKTLRQDDSEIPAAALFNDPAWQAAAHYRAGQFEQTLTALQGASTADDFYNKGNALARLGRLSEAVSSYDQALKQAPDHDDAQYNRDLVQKQLEQQQDQQSSEQQPDGDESNSGESQKNDKQQGGDDSSRKSENDQNGNEKSNEGQSDKNQQDNEYASQLADNEKNGEEQNDSEPESEQASASDKQDASSTDDLKQTEVMQANEQWLRRIPDDPGGLLRKKFLYEYQRNQQRNQQRNKKGDESSPW